MNLDELSELSWQLSLELGYMKPAERFAALVEEVGELAHGLLLHHEAKGTVAHELGTPLTSIQGYLQGMREGVFPRDERQLALIEQEAQRLGPDEGTRVQIRLPRHARGRADPAAGMHDENARTARA